MNHIPEIVNGLDFPEYDLQRYYTENIQYHLDDLKMDALKLFLSKLEPASV